MKMQTLRQAIFLAGSGQSAGLRRAAAALDGIPVNRWAETQWVIRGVEADLPLPQHRLYSIQDWIEATHQVDAGGIYRARFTEQNNVDR